MSTIANVSIIDDDETVRAALDSLLRSFGYSSRCYCSAEEFLCSDQVLETECLISDVQMPGLSGLQLLKNLREKKLAIPVILITAAADPAIRSQAERLGVSGFLNKPFDGEALVVLIQNAIGSRYS